MPSPLTARQTAVITAIRRWIRQHDLAPTARQIIEETRLSAHSVYYVLRRLAQEGIVIRRGRGRGITLSDEFAPPSGIPIVGQIAAGAPILAEENISRYVSWRDLFTDREDVFLLTVHGDSMVDRRVMPGDLIIVDPHAEVRQRDMAAVLVGGEATVKTVTWTEHELTLHSENAEKAYPPRTFGPDDDVRVLGRVIGGLREF